MALAFALLLIFGSGTFLFYKTRIDKEDADGEKALEEKIYSIYKKNLEEVRLVDLSNKVMVPLKTFYSLKENDCLAKEEEKGKCLEELEFYRVINQGKVEECEKLNIFKDDCFLKFGRIDDYKYCLEIKEEKLKEGCLSDNAYFNRKEETCGFIEEEHERIECFDRYKAMVNGGVLPDEEKGDIEKCKEINTLEYFNQCVLRSKDDCEKLGEKALADRCFGARYFTVILSSNDEKNCNLLLAESYNKVCKIYFENNKTMVDSDGDGLVDDRELWFNTDPFNKDSKIGEGFGGATGNKFMGGGSGSYDSDSDGLIDREETEKYFTDPQLADTDGDGYKDGDEVKNGFNPRGEGKL